MPVFLLSNELTFPQPHLATPEGLLAVGGDLGQERLLLAYQNGIFPWYSEGEPILWWSSDPRLVLYPAEIHISRRLNRIIRQKSFKITFDQAFESVISACARVRMQNGEGTWIVDEIIRAYCRLHMTGFAHSVEAWENGQLAGGLYGVSLGRTFFGESMFTRVSNASSVAFVTLVKYLHSMSFKLIDCQVTTAHLMRFGAREINREQFLSELYRSLDKSTLKGRWCLPEGFTVNAD